jgi:hypothetical protein
MAVSLLFWGRNPYRLNAIPFAVGKNTFYSTNTINYKIN